MAQAKTSGSHGTLTADQISDQSSLFGSAAVDTQAAPLDAFAGIAAPTAAGEASMSSLPPLNLAVLGDYNSVAHSVIVSGPTVTGGNIAFVNAHSAGGTYTVTAGYFGASSNPQHGAHGGATVSLAISNSGHPAGDTAVYVLDFHPVSSKNSVQSDAGKYHLGFNYPFASSAEASFANLGYVRVLGWNSDSVLLQSTGDGGSVDLVVSTQDMSKLANSLPSNTTFTTTGPAPVILGVTVPEVPCFAAGTRIATPQGPRTVETLAEGDDVLTHSGEAARLSWVGSRTVNCAAHPAPEKVYPVRIRRHAFGTNLPERDLLLSPDHAVFLGGVLIPIRELVNGQTVVQESVHTIRYVHIELPLHDVVLAENLPCETLLDIGNHTQFGQGPAPTPLHPDFTPTALAWEAACAPLALHGPAVEAARTLLAQRIPTARAA